MNPRYTRESNAVGSVYIVLDIPAGQHAIRICELADRRYAAVLRTVCDEFGDHSRGQTVTLACGYDLEGLRAFAVEWARQANLMADIRSVLSIKAPMEAPVDAER